MGKKQDEKRKAFGDDIAEGFFAAGEDASLSWDEDEEKGTGEVLELSSTTRVKVLLTNWELAYGSKVTCFLAENQLKVVVPAIPNPLAAGTRVDTQYGQGAIVSARSTDYVVQVSQPPTETTAPRYATSHTN